MVTAVIACCDTPPILQFTERIFNEVPTFIQRFVERKGYISGFPKRYADRHPLAFRGSRNQAASYLRLPERCCLREEGAGEWLLPCNRWPVPRSAEAEQAAHARRGPHGVWNSIRPLSAMRCAEPSFCAGLPPCGEP